MNLDDLKVGDWVAEPVRVGLGNPPLWKFWKVAKKTETRLYRNKGDHWLRAVHIATARGFRPATPEEIMLQEAVSKSEKTT